MDVYRWPEWPPQGALHLSHSSARMFDRCERFWINRYAFTYLDRPLPFALKPQGKLLGAKMLAGTLTDDIITVTLRRRYKTGEWPSLDRMLDLVPSLLREYEAWSREWSRRVRDKNRWRSGEKWGVGLRPIDRIYFGESFAREHRDEAVQRAQSCLRAWVGAGLPDDLDAYPTHQWRFPKQTPKSAIPWFWLDGHPVCASYDFIVQTPDETIIFDWKTGDSQYQQGAVEQLHGYAAYVHRDWGVPVEQIRLTPVWLSEDPVQAPTFHVEPERVAAMLAGWRGRLVDVRSDPKRITELFPMTGDLWKCKACQFQSCDGYLRAESKAGGGVIPTSVDPVDTGFDD